METWARTAEGVREARARLGVSPGELAERLGVPERRVREWEAGTRRVGRYTAVDLAREVVAHENRAALERAGLPPCPWMEAYREQAPGSYRTLEAHAERGLEHMAACPVCTARLEYAERHLPPIPDPPPMYGLLGAWVRRFPAWAQGSAFVATIFLGYGLGIVALAFATGDEIVARRPVAGSLGLLAVMVAEGVLLGAAVQLWVSFRERRRRRGREGRSSSGPHALS